MKRTEGNLLNFMRTVVITLLFFGSIAGTAAGAFNITFINNTPADNASLNQTYADIDTLITNATSNSTAFIDWDRSIIGWWRLNNESGENSTFFRDWSSWGNNAICGGFCPVSISGRFGNATSFDGKDKYVGTVTNISSGASGTMEAWIKPANITPSTNSYVMGGVNSNGANSNVTYAIFVNNLACPAKDWGTVIGNGTSAETYCSGQPYTDFQTDVWKHLAITYNGSNVSFYADGTLIKISANTVVGAGNVQPISIGRLGDVESGNYFNGTIDEVRIHRRALSPEEIGASYNATLNRLHNNFTVLGYGSYTYTAYAQNEAGNLTQTETRTLTITSSVTQVLTSIVVSPSAATLSIAGTRAFIATAFNGSNPMSGINVSWTVSNATVGSIPVSSGTTDVNGNATVTFTAFSAGTTFVNATNGSINASASVTVSSVSPVLTSLVVSPSAATLSIAGTQAFTATAFNGSDPMSGINVSWTVSNATVGSIPVSSGITDANGNVTVTFTTSAAGTTFVNATNGSKIASANVFVTQNGPPDAPTSYWGNVTINGVLGSANISVHGPNGAEVANTTSFSNGSYRISVPWISGQEITFKVNGIISGLPRTVDDSGTNNALNLSVNIYGTLGGTVVKAGTVIRIGGATVTLTNATPGYSVNATTNSLGLYSASVYPATYTINVSKTGYLSNSTTGQIVTANTSTTAPTIGLYPNTVTVTANRTVGWAEAGKDVSFNLTVVNTGDNATFSVVTAPVTNASTNVINTTIPSPLLLNNSISRGYVIVRVNNSYLGGWPVTITISNGSKSASIILNAIMRNSSAVNTTYNSTVNNSDVTGGAYLENTDVDNSTIANATLINASVQDGADISGNSTLIINATITGSGTTITDSSVIKGTYDRSYIDNSTIGNATVDSSNVTDSTLSDDASIMNSTLDGATVANSTLDNVTVVGSATITNTVDLSNIIVSGLVITGGPTYNYEGTISATTTGWAIYQNINFTKIYESVRISQLVIDQIDDEVPGNVTTLLNDSSMGFAMSVHLRKDMKVNIWETSISPDGVALLGGTKLSNFIVIRSNDTDASKVRNHTLRLYFDTDPATYTGGVKIYYYNTTAASPAWEALATTASGKVSGRWYIEAAPNHFSTYALLGTTASTTTPPGGGSSGGSGSGGGGGKSNENASNIELIEKYDLEISKDALTSYRFTHPKNPIMFVNITGRTSFGIITTSVEVLKGTSTLVNTPPEGLVYKNANIWVGTSGFATPKNIKEASVKFRIDNAWLSSNSVSTSDIVLVKWDGSKWIQLETNLVSKDDTNTIFEGKTDSFSPFAIVAKVAGATPTVTATSPPAGTPTPVPTGTPGTGAGGISTWVIGLIILVIIGAAAYYFLVVKKKQ